MFPVNFVNDRRQKLALEAKEADEKAAAERAAVEKVVADEKAAAARRPRKPSLQLQLKLKITDESLAKADRDKGLDAYWLEKKSFEDNIESFRKIAKKQNDMFSKIDNLDIRKN